MSSPLQVGKLPADLLGKLLSRAPVSDGRVLLKPGVGLDCAVLDYGDELLVLKSDPITFTSQEIGWYAIQVNANDIATTGAVPRWFLATLLLPEGATTEQMAEKLFDQLFRASEALGISIVGGHTEITYGLDRPILAGTLIGTVPRDRWVHPQQIRAGDSLLLTKGVPIEATSILARELPERLQPFLSSQEIETAANFLHEPGISILRDARLALQAGCVTGMHDPTEGGLLAALWELAQASSCSLVVNLDAVRVPKLSSKICQTLEIDPLAAIASGALLMAVSPADAGNICRELQAGGIDCEMIGTVEPGPAQVWNQTLSGRQQLRWPKVDEIARLFAEN